MRSAFGKAVKAVCLLKHHAENFGYAEAGSRTRNMEFFFKEESARWNAPEPPGLPQKWRAFYQYHAVAGSRGKP